MLMIKVRMPVGTALEETDRVVGLVEAIMARMPEITMISAQVGSQAEQDAGDQRLGFANAGTHEGLLWVGLVKRDQRKESDLQILERIRRQLPNLKGVRFEALDMSQMMLGGSAAPVEIKLFGKELETLKGQADQIVARSRASRACAMSPIPSPPASPRSRSRSTASGLTALGLSVYQVASTVQTATLGRVATRYREGTDEIDVRLRFWSNTATGSGRGPQHPASGRRGPDGLPRTDGRHQGRRRVRSRSTARTKRAASP